MGRASIRGGLAVFAWFLLAGAEFLNSSWLAAVASLFLLLAAMYTLGGAALVRDLLPVWLFLWLLVPPPFGLDNTLVIILQTLTTRWSSSLLDFVRIQHVIAGHIMEVGGQRLFVEEACAGINSLFSILACTLFYVLFTRVPILRAAVLVLASIAWVLLANVARVFLIAYLSQRWNIQLAEGWRHEALGYLLFAVALGLIWSTNQLLLFLTPPRWSKNANAVEATVPPEEVAPPADKIAWTASIQQTWLNSWVAGAAFGLLLLGHFFLYGVPQTAFAGPGDVASGVAKLNEDSLPRELDGWKRDKMSADNRSVGNAYGQYSKFWTYRGDVQSAVVSFDYPFAAWHNLSECYYGQGWDLEPPTNHTSESPGPAHFCEQRMKKSGLRSGYLLYCQFDTTGQILTPPPRGVAAPFQRQESALRRLLAWNEPQSDVVRPTGSVYQFQVFVETYAPLTPPEQIKTRARFFHAYEEIRHQLFSKEE